MGLYRNIAGVGDNQQIGLSFYNPGPITFSLDLGDSTLSSGGSLLPVSPITDLTSFQQQQDTAHAAYEAEMLSRYDWLLNHSMNEITDAGFYVTLDTGSVFQWTDPGHTSSIAYLVLYDIQKIENERGTAGTLLMHLQEPVLAKDTAGYAGGAASSTGSTDIYSTPIPEVQSLPPVVPDESGGVTYDPVIVTATTSDTSTPTTYPTTTTVPTPLPVDQTTAIKNNLLPLVTVAGILVVAIAGDRLIKKRGKLVFAGGIGALYYMMAKK